MSGNTEINLLSINEMSSEIFVLFLLSNGNLELRGTTYLYLNAEYYKK